ERGETHFLRQELLPRVDGPARKVRATIHRYPVDQPEQAVPGLLRGGQGTAATLDRVWLLHQRRTRSALFLGVVVEPAQSFWPLNPLDRAACNIHLGWPRPRSGSPGRRQGRARPFVGATCSTAVPTNARSRAPGGRFSGADLS